jgi:hypothetical protein
MISKDEMLAACKRKYVTVKAFGGDVKIRVMTTSERTAFEQSLQDRKGRVDSVKQATMRERLIAACVADAAGDLMFSDADLPQLAQLPADDAERLVEAIQRACGWTKQDIESLGNDHSGDV